MTATILMASVLGGTAVSSSAISRQEHLIAPLMIGVLGAVMFAGMFLAFVALRMMRSRRASHRESAEAKARDASMRLRVCSPVLFEMPGCWLAIRNTNLAEIQTALRLTNPTPCSWSEGMANLSQHKLFIAPPVNDWTLVFGRDLPQPASDPDECFHFVRHLSRRLGHVQLFSVNQVVYFHSWVKAENGRILRAYAWAGETVWNQGRPTAAEADLGMRCFEYGETMEPVRYGQPNPVQHNAERIMSLASRWSMDPTAIDERTWNERFGITGDCPQSTLH